MSFESLRDFRDRRHARAYGMAQDIVLDFFPVVTPTTGSLRVSDDFGAPRRGPPPHTHAGNDIFGPEGTPLLAVRAGRTSRHTSQLGGLDLDLTTPDGLLARYVHLQAYEGPDRDVQAGEVIGYLGQTGNACNTWDQSGTVCLQGDPQLHFELRPGGGAPVDPHPALMAAPRASLSDLVPATPPASRSSSSPVPAVAAVLLFLGLARRR